MPRFEPGERPVSPADPLNFTCRGCGGCCTWTTPFVNPHDIWRLARHLGRTTGEILDRTTLVMPGAGAAPLLQITLDGTTGECLWLDHETRRCLVHPARPLSCRAFPVGVRHAGDGDRLSLARTLPECRGEGRGRGSVGEYLHANLAPDELPWSRAYAALAGQVFPPGEDRTGDLEYLAYYLHTLFDLDGLPGADFAARFRAAAARLARAARQFQSPNGAGNPRPGSE